MRYLRRWACGLPFALLTLPPAWAEGGSGVRRFQLTAISFGYEVRHERILFNFHNPSSFNTATLVPHEFVQTYTVDNQWGVIRGRYSLLGLDMESEAGITPQKTNHASDVDTFYQPDGNVVASGTTGNASMRSYMFSQRAWLLDVKGTRIGGGYKYQRNRADYQFGYSFETQTKPPSQILERLPIPETTNARIHEFEVGIQHRWNLSPAVRFTGEVYFSPAAAGFLSTLLPVKYPGQDIVFSSVSYGVAPRIAVAFQAGKVPLEISTHYGRYFAYGQSGFWRELLGFEVRFGWGTGF